jgi:hypothetical protein
LSLESESANVALSLFNAINLTISEDDARAMAAGAAEMSEIVGLVDESEEDSEESDESEDDGKESAHSMVHSVSPSYGK